MKQFFSAYGTIKFVPVLLGTNSHCVLSFCENSSRLGYSFFSVGNWMI